MGSDNGREERATKEERVSRVNGERANMPTAEAFRERRWMRDCFVQLSTPWVSRGGRDGSTRVCAGNHEAQA